MDKIDLEKIKKSEWAKQFGKDIWLVGGCVRDIYREAESNDYDFMITNYSYDEVVEKLKPFGKVNDIDGRSFRVIKFIPKGFIWSIDISLPRIDIKDGEGHKGFQVQEATLEQDLYRRDFTMNSMAIQLFSLYGSENSYFDPYGGMKDIRNKTIRATNPDTFVDDPLRIIRAIRFTATMGFIIEPDTYIMMRKAISNGVLKSLPVERIRMEIEKTALVPGALSFFFLMFKWFYLIPIFFPEMEAAIGFEQPKQYHDFTVFEHCIRACSDKRLDSVKLQMAAFLHDIGKPSCYKDGHFINHEDVGADMAYEIMRRLSFPYYICSDVKWLIKFHMFDWHSVKSIRRLMTKNNLYPNFMKELIKLRVADKNAQKEFISGNGPGDRNQLLMESMLQDVIEKETIYATKFKSLDFNGENLIYMDFKPGPIFKTILEDVLEQVSEGNLENDCEAIEKYVGEKYQKQQE